MTPRNGLVLLCACLACSGLANSGEYNGDFARVPAADPPTQRLIVKWRATPVALSDGKPSDPSLAARKLSAASGVRMKHASEIAAGLAVLELERAVRGPDLDALLASVRSDPDVEFADPDQWNRPHRVPSDVLFPGQWSVQAQEIASTRAVNAWDTTTGSAGTIIAILDTGVRYDHPDLGAASVQGPGKSLPGFDFVSGDAVGTFVVANDGDGRDANPSDPGDWIDSNDLQQPALEGRNCSATSSSWHGTRVAGLVSALSDNGIGVAGMSWNSWILPVRVLGKCGGFDSDILTAIRWAAGLPVNGVATNPFPAHIVNMSLGSDGPCGNAKRLVIEEVVARGVIVVASAGNDGGPVDAPANCPGVIAVGALRHIGTKVGFSNVGPRVSISAPGGNCVNNGAPCLFSIDTTINLGSTTPSASSYTDQHNFNVGTSFSAPIVAGAVALMHSVNARLPPSRVIPRLAQSARPFPTTSTTVPAPPVCHVPANELDLQQSECICTTSTCGAGMLDAQAAVAAAQRPAVVISVPVVTPGQDIVLDGSASAASCNRSIVSYSWIAAPNSPVQPPITNADQPQATVQAPTQSSDSYILRLTVTDNLGATDFADVTVVPNNAITSATPLLPGPACPVAITPPQTPANDDAVTPPPPPSGGGGGGGSGGGGNLLWFELVPLFALWAGSLRPTRRRLTARRS